MEEIVQKIEQLTEVVGRNMIPMWITIVGAFGPIIVSLLVVWQSYRQNKKNNELQKQIENNNELLQKKLSERDEKSQMRGDFLKIYDEFCLAQSILAVARNNIHIIFSNFSNISNMPMQWINSINQATNAICQAVNRAKLLLPPSDNDLRKVLEEVYNSYKEIENKATSYYYSGQAMSASESAWCTISPSWKVTKYDYNALQGNPPAYNDYLKLCVNETTKELEIMILKTLSYYSYDRFDRYFEPYLQMTPMEVGLDSAKEN